MIVRRSFPLDRTSVAASRRFVVDALKGVPDDVRESAELMMSELATNAVVHAGTGFEVGIERTATLFRVDVTDVGGGDPQPQSPSISEPHGRGLQIVRQLSDDWGVLENPDQSSKTVWYAVRLDPESTTAGDDRVPERRQGRQTGAPTSQVGSRQALTGDDHSGGTDGGRTRALGRRHALGAALGLMERPRCRRSGGLAGPSSRG